MVILSNQGFKASSVSYYEFKNTWQLPTVENLNVFEVSGKVYVEWSEIDANQFIYANPSIYYVLYINGVALSFSFTNGDAKDITNNLWGGDNYICVQANDSNEDLYSSSELSDYEYYRFDKNFDALINVAVVTATENGDYKQYVEFDTFKINGLSTNEVSELDYFITVKNLDTDAEDYLTSGASLYSSSKYRIDITDLIDDTPGNYEITIYIMSFSKQIEYTNNLYATMIIGESDEATANYTHLWYVDQTTNIYAKVFDVNADLTSSDYMDTQVERSVYGGVEMASFLLYYEVELPETFVNFVDYLKYVIWTDNYEFEISVPTNYNYGEITVTRYAINDLPSVNFTTFGGLIYVNKDGVYKTYAMIELLPLLESKGFSVDVPGEISIKVKSLEQGYFMGTEYPYVAFVYDYMLAFDDVLNVEVVEIDGLTYAKWDIPLNQFANNFKIDIVSKGISLVINTTSQQAFSNFHGTLNQSTVAFSNLSVNESLELLIINGCYYVNITDYLYAGYNKVGVQILENTNNSYLSSNIVYSDNYEYYLTLLSPAITLSNASANTNLSALSSKGIVIIINPTLTNEINYNLDALYKINVNGQMLVSNTNSNSDESPIILDYDQTLITNNFSLGYDYITFTLNGIKYTSKITYNLTNNVVEVTWELPFTGHFVITVTALGQGSEFGSNNKYTLDSDSISDDIDVIFSVEVPTLIVLFYDENGQRASGIDNSLIANQVELIWSSSIKYFSNVNYEITVYRNGIVLKVLDVTNITRLILNSSSSGEYLELYNMIINYPGMYEFKIRSLGIDAISDDAESSYLISDYGSFTYAYYLGAEEVTNISLQYMSGTNNTYLRFKVGSITTNLELQNYVKFTITVQQVNTSYNVYGEESAYEATYQSQTAVYYSESKLKNLESFEAGYFYYLIDQSNTAKFYPGINNVSIINEGYLLAYLLPATSATITQLIHSNKVLDTPNISYSNYIENSLYSGVTLTFDNVEFNKNLAYVISAQGGEYSDIKNVFFISAQNSSLIYNGYQKYSIDLSSYFISDDNYKAYSLDNVYLLEISKNYEVSGTKEFVYVITFTIFNGGVADIYNITTIAIGDDIHTLNSASITKNYLMQGTLAIPEISTDMNYTNIASTDVYGSTVILTVNLKNLNASEIVFNYRLQGKSIWNKITIASITEDYLGFTIYNSNVFTLVYNDYGKISGLTINLWYFLKLATDYDYNPTFFKTKGVWEFAISAVNDTQINNQNRYSQTSVTSSATQVTVYRYMQAVAVADNASLSKITFSNASDIITWYASTSGNKSPQLIIEYRKKGETTYNPLLVVTSFGSNYSINYSAITAEFLKDENLSIGYYYLKFYVISSDSEQILESGSYIYISELTYTKNNVYNNSQDLLFAYKASLPSLEFNAKLETEYLNYDDYSNIDNASNLSNIKYIYTEQEYTTSTSITPYYIMAPYSTSDYAAFLNNRTMYVEFKLLFATNATGSIGKTITIPLLIQPSANLDIKYLLSQITNSTDIPKGNYILSMQPTQLTEVGDDYFEFMTSGELSYFAFTVYYRYPSVESAYLNGDDMANPTEIISFTVSVNNSAEYSNLYSELITEFYCEILSIGGSKSISGTCAYSSTTCTYIFTEAVSTPGDYVLRICVQPSGWSTSIGTSNLSFVNSETYKFLERSPVYESDLFTVKSKLLIDTSGQIIQIVNSKTALNQVTINLSLTSSDGSSSISLDSVYITIKFTPLDDNLSESTFSGEYDDLIELLTTAFGDLDDVSLYAGLYNVSVTCEPIEAEDIDKFIESEPFISENERYYYTFGYLDWNVEDSNGVTMSENDTTDHIGLLYSNMGDSEDMELCGKVTQFSAPAIYDGAGNYVSGIEYNFYVYELISGQMTTVGNDEDGSTVHKTQISDTVSDGKVYSPILNTNPYSISYASSTATKSNEIYITVLKLRLKNTKNYYKIADYESYFIFLNTLTETEGGENEDIYYSHANPTNTAFYGFYAEERLPSVEVGTYSIEESDSWGVPYYSKVKYTLKTTSTALTNNWQIDIKSYLGTDVEGGYSTIMSSIINNSALIGTCSAIIGGVAIYGLISGGAALTLGFAASGIGLPLALITGAIVGAVAAITYVAYVEGDTSTAILTNTARAYTHSTNGGIYANDCGLCSVRAIPTTARYSFSDSYLLFWGNGEKRIYATDLLIEAITDS